MKTKIKPDLSLFKAFVVSADLFLLKKMRGIINREIVKAEPEAKHTLTDAKPIPYGSDLLFDTPKLALTSLLRDDWGYLFGSKDDGRNDYYVYYHADPKAKSIKFRYETSYVDMRIPFYIGMGRGERIYSFSRSVMHTSLLNDMATDGYTKQEIMKVYKGGMGRTEALMLESKLILFFGIKTAIPDAKIKKGTKAYSGHRPSLLNNRYEPFPEIYNNYAYNGAFF